jgi:glycosyltransferase involved in cell wall biosynthesis
MRRLDSARIRWDPWLRNTYSSAACVLAIAPYVRDFLEPVVTRRVELMSETGIEQLPPIVSRPARGGPVRLLYVGRVVRTKGLRDLLRAMTLLGPTSNVVLDVVGDGFDRRHCEDLVHELRLREIVRFHGTIPRSDVDQFYRAADIFVLPSYREPGGNAVMEAMSFGVPLVIADRGGPASVVDPECAFAIPPIAPEQFARDLASAIRALVGDPSLRARMGEAARRRIADVALWDRKVDRMVEIYGETLAATPVDSRGGT